MRYFLLVFSVLVPGTLGCGSDDSNSDGAVTADAASADSRTALDSASPDSGNPDGGNNGDGSQNDGTVADGGSEIPRGALRFYDRDGQDDFGRLIALPGDFGQGAFTFEFWVRISGDGPLFRGDPDPYSSDRWWANGTWILDGHNNMRAPEAMRTGTFDLMLYGGGRMRWLLHDGEQLWGVQSSPTDAAPSLNDAAWHHIAAVRRLEGEGSALELWVDGTLTGVQRSSGARDLRTYWSPWPGPATQQGWFVGGEKRSATGDGAYQFDYDGWIAEMRFWSIARSEADLRDRYDETVPANSVGLAGYFSFGEGSGDRACDSLDAARCVELTSRGHRSWSTDGPPLTAP